MVESGLMETRLNCNSEIATVFNAVEGHCLQAKKVVHHHANGRFDWLISGHQSVNPSREAISILSEKFKRFTFGHPVSVRLSLVSIYSKRHDHDTKNKAIMCLGNQSFKLIALF